MRAIEYPGKVLRPCGHGIGPGEGFLCDDDPGGLYEEPEIFTSLPCGFGRTEESPADGLHQSAPVPVGLVALGRHGISTRYLRASGADSVMYQCAPRE